MIEVEMILRMYGKVLKWVEENKPEPTYTLEDLKIAFEAARTSDGFVDEIKDLNMGGIVGPFSAKYKTYNFT